MREARGKKQFGAPGKGGPAGFASYSPRPQLLRGFTKEKGNAKSTSGTKPSDGIAATRGSVADAFFGASPVVASALGTAPSATPARLIEPTMGDSGNDSKPELSTLLGTGSFYFALTPLLAISARSALLGRGPVRASHASLGVWVARARSPLLGSRITRRLTPRLPISISRLREAVDGPSSARTVPVTHGVMWRYRKPTRRAGRSPHDATACRRLHKIAGVCPIILMDALRCLRPSGGLSSHLSR